MFLTAGFANRLYFLLAKLGHYRFVKGSRNLQKAQAGYLLKILNRNSNSEYGKKNNFRIIKSVDQYQIQAPIIEYSDIVPYITKILQGSKEVLTSEKVNRFSLTSGTTEHNKLIPFTRSLKIEFNRALKVWIFDIFRQYPDTLDGKALWIITPPGEIPFIESKVPIGFEEDSGYFGFLGKYLIRSIMVLPDEVAKIRNTENYFYLVAYFMLCNEGLRLISIWNPKILPIILDKIILHKNSLIKDIGEGSLNLPDSSEAVLFRRYQKADKKRSDVLKSILVFDVVEKVQWNKIWPKLTLISCWMDAWAATFIEEIKKLFPETAIQGKGLLATEGIISIPYCGKNILSFNSQFYEFKDEGSGEIKLAHELKIGKKYEVIITTGGGLYRYILHDIIKVTGFYNDLPQIQFIGKNNLVSDLVGEKLNDIHVSRCLDSISLKYDFEHTFYFLSPTIKESSRYYTLYVESEIELRYQDILNESETLLSENFYYLQARNLGQLGIIRLFLLNKNAHEIYLKKKSINAQPGTVKTQRLDKEINWHEFLPGKFFEPDNFNNKSLTHDCTT